MNIRLPFKQILFGMCFLASLFGNSLTAGKLPNILLIVSEDNGPELGCYGDKYVKTPVLDNLARQGILFQNAYVPQAGCSQSRAAFLTGLYPHQNGQIGLATWKFGLYMDNTPNIVTYLKSAGYRTGIIGKLHVNPASAFPFDFKAIPSSNFSRKNLSDYAARAEEFIGRSKTPFFLSVNYPDPHRPFTRQVDGLPADPLSAEDVEPLPYFGVDSPDLREQTANYYNCMNRLDSLIGDLLEKLNASGKANNTLVIYLGDHGADLLRGKRTSYEGGVRIPLIIKWPGKIDMSRISHHLVSSLDILPTVLQATGNSIPNHLEGQSLIPLFRHNLPHNQWREFLFTEFHTHSAHNYFPQRTVRDQRFKLIHNLLPNEVNPGYAFTLNRFFSELRSVIEAAPKPVKSAYKLMEKPPEFELYDLHHDPYEFNNLAGHADYAGILKSLTSRLYNWRIRTSDPMLNPLNIRNLQTEINNCFQDGTPTKSRLSLNYPEYFFSQ